MFENRKIETFITVNDEEYSFFIKLFIITFLPQWLLYFSWLLLKFLIRIIPSMLKFLTPVFPAMAVWREDTMQVSWMIIDN